MSTAATFIVCSRAPAAVAVVRDQTGRARCSARGAVVREPVR